MIENSKQFYWNQNTLRIFYSLSYDDNKINFKDFSVFSSPANIWQNCSVWFNDFRQADGTVYNQFIYNDIMMPALDTIRKSIHSNSIWLLPSNQNCIWPVYIQEVDVTVCFKVRQLPNQNVKYLLASIVLGRNFN